MVKPTKRQAVLLDRLVDFVASSWRNPHLPCETERLLGYGSFFWGKPNPGDVDLCGTAHPFKPHLLSKTDGSFAPPAVDEWLSRCRVAARSADVRARASSLLPADAPNDVREWFSCYSVNQLFFAEGFDADYRYGTAEDILHRMLSRHSGVHIAGLNANLGAIVRPADEAKLHLCQPLVTVWSKDQTDTRHNVMQMWESPEPIQLAEWRHLRGQLLLLDDATQQLGQTRPVSQEDRDRSKVAAQALAVEFQERLEAGKLPKVKPGETPGVALPEAIQLARCQVASTRHLLRFWSHLCDGLCEGGDDIESLFAVSRLIAEDTRVWSRATAKTWSLVYLGMTKVFFVKSRWPGGPKTLAEARQILKGEDDDD